MKSSAILFLVESKLISARVLFHFPSLCKESSNTWQVPGSYSRLPVHEPLSLLLKLPIILSLCIQFDVFFSSVPKLLTSFLPTFVKMIWSALYLLQHVFTSLTITNFLSLLLCPIYLALYPKAYMPNGFINIKVTNFLRLRRRILKSFPK